MVAVVAVALMVAPGLGSAGEKQWGFNEITNIDYFGGGGLGSLSGMDYDESTNTLYLLSSVNLYLKYPNCDKNLMSWYSFGDSPTVYGMQFVEGNLWISQQGVEYISVLNSDNSVLKTIPTTGYWGVSLYYDGSSVYAACVKNDFTGGCIYKITTDGKATQYLTGGDYPFAVCSDNSFVYFLATDTTTFNGVVINFQKSNSKITVFETETPNGGRYIATDGDGGLVFYTDATYYLKDGKMSKLTDDQSLTGAGVAGYIYYSDWNLQVMKIIKDGEENTEPQPAGVSDMLYSDTGKIFMWTAGDGGIWVTDAPLPPTEKPTSSPSLWSLFLENLPMIAFAVLVIALVAIPLYYGRKHTKAPRKGRSRR